MSVNVFVDKMAAEANARERDGLAKPPCSTRQIGKFLRGDAVPRDEVFSKVAAKVLGGDIRWQKLHRDEGPWTNAVAYSTLTVTAPAKTIVGRTNDAEATVMRLAAIAKPLADWRAGLAAYADVWDRYIASSPAIPDREQQLRIAERLWKLAVAPLIAFGADPAEASLRPYYLCMFAAMMAAIPAPGQGPDLSRAPHQPTTRKP